MIKANSVVITAIIVLAVIEIAAMYYGVNGTLRTIIVAAICGLAGWRIPINEKGGT